MKERLIKLIQNAVNGCARYWAEVIADYLIANGVIALPVKIGQTVWEVVSWDENVRECRVSSLTQKADGTFKIRITNLKSKSAYERVPQHIGDIIFLTKEEAEQALTCQKSRQVEKGE